MFRAYGRMVCLAGEFVAHCESSERAKQIAAALNYVGLPIDKIPEEAKLVLETLEDTAFIQQYSDLPEETRRQIRKITDILNTNGDTK